MSNTTFGLLISAMLVASPALAQTTGDRATAAPAKPAPTTGTTISGVTVEGARPMPSKGCSSRDKVCVAMVVAELKARYPEQLLQWCHEVERRAVVSNLNIDDINSTSGSNVAHSESGQFAPPAVARSACASDKK
ncbi:MAG TPA: hypothetical protein VHN39_14030 [Phenylobacterium sp.]|jgi:hypothetical protein|nr:hypothetical protein [Phenylobacterium sp.]